MNYFGSSKRKQMPGYGGRLMWQQLHKWVFWTSAQLSVLLSVLSTQVWFPGRQLEHGRQRTHWSCCPGPGRYLGCLRCIQCWASTAEHLPWGWRASLSLLPCLVQSLASIEDVTWGDQGRFRNVSRWCWRKCSMHREDVSVNSVCRRQKEVWTYQIACMYPWEFVSLFQILDFLLSFIAPKG